MGVFTSWNGVNLPVPIKGTTNCEDRHHSNDIRYHHQPPSIQHPSLLGCRAVRQTPTYDPDGGLAAPDNTDVEAPRHDQGLTAALVRPDEIGV